MHEHLVSLHRISADNRAGGSILPREVVAAAQEGSTFFGSFFPSGKKEHKQRQSVAVAYGERRTFSGDHTTCGASRLRPYRVSRKVYVRYIISIVGE